MARIAIKAPCFIILHILAVFTIKPALSGGLGDEFAVVADHDVLGFHGDYTPPSPPPPPALPLPPPLSCEDLEGVGSIDSTCELNKTLEFDGDVYIKGLGNLYILPGVHLSCPFGGCFMLVNISGNFSLGQNGVFVAGTVHVVAHSVSLIDGSLINVSGLAGEPPEETSGTPQGVQGAGGGHGGRGANCLTDNEKLPDDVWGGDAYSWQSLDKPYSYGSKGGTTSKEEDYGGEGGGRIKFEVESEIEVSGSLSADGGDGGVKGGGGSGGSIYIRAHRM